MYVKNVTRRIQDTLHLGRALIICKVNGHNSMQRPMAIFGMIHRHCVKTFRSKHI